MSADNPSFRSYSGDYFWVPASPEEQEKIADRIEKDCKKGHVSGAVYITAVVIFILFQIITFMYLEVQPSTFIMILMVIFFWTIFPIMGSMVTSSRYIKKAKEGKFFCRHVTIEDKIRIDGTFPSFQLTLKSTGDRTDTAEVDIEGSLYNKVSKGVTGMFVMIEDEPRKILVSPFWFIADTDPVPVSVVEEKETAEAPAVPFEPEENLHKRIRQRYYRYCTSYITYSATAALLFMVESLFMVVAFTSLFARMVILLSVPVYFTALLLVSHSFIKQIIRGHSSYSIFHMIWINLNFISLAILTKFMEKGGPVVYAAIGITFVINMLTILLVNRGLSATSRRISDKDYLVLPATVISKDAVRIPISFRTSYRCSVRTEDNKTYDIEIDKGIYDTIREGSKGYILFLGDKESDRFFV